MLEEGTAKALCNQRLRVTDNAGKKTDTAFYEGHGRDLSSA
jgi:hypothetical protein